MSGPSDAFGGDVVDRWERKVQLGAHPLAYPFMRAIARRGPVVRVPRIGVVVSDATLARQVITDTETFSKAAKGSPADLWTPVLGPAVLLNMTGDDHARMRKQLSGMFTPGYVRRVCERTLSGVLERMRADLVAGREVDVVLQARLCAGAVISEMVGMPYDPEAFEDLYERTTSITGLVRLHRAGFTRKQVVYARSVLDELTAPAEIAYHRTDVETVAGRMRELGLSPEEARSTVAAFVLTGTETLVSFIPRLIAMAYDGGWLDRMAFQPEVVDPVVTEAFRVAVPSPVMLRGVVAEGRVGSVDVHPGDRMVISTLSSARALGGFDPDRPHPPALRQLWFGAGVHFCLGMPLAMAEITRVLDTVLAARREVKGLDVVRREVGRHRMIPGYETLFLQARTT
ncbi:cytochrome P450 [Spongisporangium articulatum]|uniref:Cytochrome P450 n=1 Tax=Spongisporangium articulatum TaxID=3362603 RepID=A0ABW8APG5_9ACTN